MNCNIVNSFYNLKELHSILMYLKIVFIPLIEEQNFQQPLLHSSVSRDHSNMPICCSIIYLYYFKNFLLSVFKILLNIFMGTVMC